MRLLIAAELPEHMIEALAETSALLRACVRGRYVAPDSLHVTLAFLGEVPGSQANSAIGALEAACSGFGRFEASLGALGDFGRRTTATLWQGFDDAGDLPALADAVRGELQARGFAFDEKRFLPHITLMRKTSRAACCRSDCSMWRNRHGHAVQVEPIGRAPPLYEPLRTIVLP